MASCVQSLLSAVQINLYFDVISYCIIEVVHINRRAMYCAPSEYLIEKCQLLCGPVLNRHRDRLLPC